MPQPPNYGPRLYKLSRNEMRMNPPTQEERRLSEILSRYSMLCRWGKFKEADDLFGSQTQGDQMTISKVCNEKTRDALNDTAQYGRVVLASERKMLEKAEDEKGRPLTREEVQACFEQERTRPRRRKPRNPDGTKQVIPKLSKKEKARFRGANGPY